MADVCYLVLDQTAADTVRRILAEAIDGLAPSDGESAERALDLLNRSLAEARADPGEDDQIDAAKALMFEIGRLCRGERNAMVDMARRLLIGILVIAREPGEREGTILMLGRAVRQTLGLRLGECGELPPEDVEK